MANLYTKGTVVPFLIPTDAAFRIFKLLAGEPEAALDEEVWAALPDNWHAEGDAGEHYLTEELQDGFYALSWEQPEDVGDTAIYIWTEEGSPDSIAEIVQWLLTQDTTGARWATFEGAHVCSRMRPGQFGGFAWFITRDSLACSGTQAWILEQVRTFDAA